MRAFIKNYLEAEKARREEEGREGGFSLIELIVVVVILGILAAVAIPIFLNIQDQARKSTLEAAAANGATQAAAAVAKTPTTTLDAAFFANLAADENQDGTNDVTLALSTAAGEAYTAGDIDSICVIATRGSGATATTAKSGPNCN